MDGKVRFNGLTFGSLAMKSKSNTTSTSPAVLSELFAGRLELLLVLPALGSNRLSMLGSPIAVIIYRHWLFSVIAVIARFG